MNLTFHKGRGEECWNLQCGEPLETKTTYYWSVRNTTYGKNESKPTDNTYELCSEYFGCMVKCKREYDCSETPWKCFNGGITKDSKERRRKRALDVNSEQLHICEAIPEEHSASRTIIAVCVVVAVIVVIAVAVAAVWQFRKKRNSHTVPSRESDEPTFCVHKTDQPESLSFLAATTQSNDGSTCESGQKLEVAG
ncbi:uncharacterized protein [Haliotis asinina]|uniref:uncharacterized protein n=1 Tax=Haliotis asinina TaxID=109174 RepID=UPI003531DBEC